MPIGKGIGIGFDMLDLPDRGDARKNLGHQLARLLAVKIGALAATKLVESIVELTLEPVDQLRVEAPEAFLVDELIKPVLPLDQEVQSPLPVLDVEGEKIIHPGRERLVGLRFELKSPAIRALVD